MYGYDYELSQGALNRAMLAGATALATDAPVEVMVSISRDLEMFTARVRHYKVAGLN